MNELLTQHNVPCHVRLV